MRRSEICESPNVALLPTTIGDSIVVWYTAQQRSISKEFSFNLSLSNVFKFHVDIDLQSNDAWPTTHEWMKCKRKPPNWTITFFSGDDDANADESDPDWRCRGRDAAELMVAPVMLLLRWKNTFTFLSLALVLCPCSWLCSVFFFFSYWDASTRVHNCYRLGANYKKDTKAIASVLFLFFFAIAFAFPNVFVVTPLFSPK